MHWTQSYCIILFLFCCIFTAKSQQEYQLSGTIVSDTNTPIAFANVILTDKEGTLIQGAISEDNGAFVIEKLTTARYILKVTFVGFTDYISEPFELTKNLVLPSIILKENSESLDEVTIIGEKPKIIRAVDRIIFNVENTVLSNGNSWEILKRAPGVISNQNELSIRGQGATIYLNDKKVQLDAEEVKSLLENLDSNTLKAVEVISNPPAKYDAEGGPVLNIITSKAITPGYKGNINVAGTYAIFPKYKLGTSHFLKNEKINLFFNYNFNPRREIKEDESFIDFMENGQSTAFWDIDFERQTRSRNHNANFILDYTPDNKNTISFSAIGLYAPNVRFNNTTGINVANTSTPDFTIGTLSDLTDDKSNIALDLKYKYQLKQGSISTNFHYTTFNRDRVQNLSSRYLDTNDDLFLTVDFNTDASQDIEIYTGQIDYTTTLGKFSFDAGAKFSVIDSQSTFDFFDIENNAITFNQGLSDNFLYDENIYATYISVSRNWDKWNFKAGLRGEQTNSTGTSLVLNTINELDYFEWFPTSYIQYAPSDNHSFSLDYGRRLDRPRYQDLNPFSYFLNENNFSTGNPNLIPSFSNNLNLNYTLKGEYFFDFYYRDNGDNILTLVFQDNQNFIQRTERQNATGSQSYGIDFTHGRSITKWWYFYTYMSLFHEEESFNASESGNVEFTNEVDGFYGQFYNSFSLDQAKTFSAELTLTYLSNFISGSSQLEPNTNLAIGLRKSLWKKRAVVTVAAEDLLGEANSFLISRYLNQNNGFRSVPETQFIRVGFTYNFGNFRLRDNNRELDKNERDRLNGED